MAPSSHFLRQDGVTLAEIARECSAELMQSEAEDVRVFAIAPLARAAAGEITFINSRKSLQELEKSQATAVFCSLAHVAYVPHGVASLVTSHPQVAFARAAALLHPDAATPSRIDDSDGVSPLASVDPAARLEDGVIIEAGARIAGDVEIGAGSVIGAGAVIGPGSRIGRNCHIGPNAVIQHALLGNRVIVHPGACIGQDGFGYVPSREGMLKIAQIGRVIIQDNVEIGANSCIDRGAMDDTVIGEGTKIDNLVQIGHNVRIGRHCVFAALVGVAGSAVIGDMVMIGGAAGVNGHITIGDGAMIAALSGVGTDVPARARWGGIPARPMRGFLRDAAEAIARAGGTDTGDKGGESQ